MEEDDDANKSVKGLEWGGEGCGHACRGGFSFSLICKIENVFCGRGVASEMSII